jgi:2-oxoglutarate dehydrogenase E2 component (dihydrolipoamide succinyltransferase)
MPQLGETVTEGTITKWFKNVGEAVDRDEPLFEVSTDKVDSEVPSPAAGQLSEIRVAEGDTVDVGTVLAVIAEGGSGATAVADTAPTSAPAPPPPPQSTAPAQAPPIAPEPAPASAPPVSPAPAQPVASAPPAGPRAPAEPAVRSLAPPPPPAVDRPAVGSSTPASPDGGSAGGTLLLSPVVRRLLEDNGLDPAEITGTGTGGRITRQDVLAVIDARRAGGVPAARESVATRAPAPAPATAARLPSAAQAAPAGVPATTGAAPGALAGTDEIIPFTNIRRRTAEHMVRSKATSAHTLVVKEADFERVEQVRRSAGDRFRAEEGFSLTYLPFVARATVEALQELPQLNASVGDDALIVHHEVNLGIAVDLDRQGLIVPVIHRAEELTLRGIARRIHDLAARARSRKLSADDISGGTFSITNPGPFGTFLTGPIINQPQVGILSTDGVKRRPVVVEQADGTEAIAIHSIGLVSLAWDHRAVDGAYAATFVARIVELLSARDWAAEL